MCGRYTLTLTKDELLTRIAELDAAGWHVERRYNIAPGQVSITIRPRNDRWAVQEARWGLVPAWAKDSPTAPRPINARAETVASKPTFRGGLKHGRCLVPASGFYEWKTGASPKARKVPFYIHPVDGDLWCFAGLADAGTFAILTTEPNELMAPIHDRMPVILPREAWGTWLEAPEPPLGFLVPCPAELMAAHEVGPAVGNVRNEGPGLLDRGKEGLIHY